MWGPGPEQWRLCSPLSTTWIEKHHWRLLHSFLLSVNHWASHIGIHKGFHSLCMVQKWLCLLCFAKHVVKCETIITLLLSFGGLEWNSVAGFQGPLRKKRLFAVTFMCVRVINLLLKLQRSHFAVVIVLTDYCLIIPNMKHGTNISYFRHHKKFRIIYGLTDSYNSCIILLLSCL